MFKMNFVACVKWVVGMDMGILFKIKNGVQSEMKNST